MMNLAAEDLPDGATKVRLDGRLDVTGAGQIETRFSALAGARRALIVDLSAVDFIASMGIRMLLLGANAVKANHGRMVLLGARPDVAAVLKTARIDAIVPMYDDLPAAAAAVHG